MMTHTYCLHVWNCLHVWSFEYLFLTNGTGDKSPKSAHWLHRYSWFGNIVWTTYQGF